jgi:hypothetical protein
MPGRNSKPAFRQTNPLSGLAKVCLIGLTAGLSGCAFFDQPVDDLGTITPGAPPSSSTLPPPLPDSGNAPPRLPNSTDAGSASPPPLTPPGDNANATGTLPTLPGQSAYLTVASLIDIPEDATNLAFIHFTQNQDSARALAVCQAAMNNLPLVSLENIPAGADTVMVWPVNNSEVGGSCLEMIANYEALDISNATAERVNDTARGPFVLTRNTRQGNRLIYDLSFIDRNKFSGAIDEWRSLLGSDPANWPEYRPAR